MTRRLLKSSAFLIFPLLLTLLSPVRAFADTLSVWVQSGSDRVFSSTPVPAAPETAIMLYAARGETQAAQIALRSGAGATGVTVVPGDLTGPAGAVIPAADITVNREYNHPNVPKDLTAKNPSENPPDGGNSYYDSFYGNDPFQLAANLTQPYFYSVAVPATQAPGTYAGTATVQSSAGSVVAVPVQVVVYPVTLPPANQSTFKMDNWFGSAGWDFLGTVQAIPLQYGVTQFDPNWWKVIGNIATDLAKHRNNVIHTDFQGLAIPDTTTWDANGNPVLGWTTFDRFVQTFIDAGALQYIYTPHMIRGDGTHPLLSELQNDGTGKAVQVLVPTGSTQATTYLDSVFAQLKAHLDSKCLDQTPTCAPGRHWSDVLYMSAVDEPGTQAQTDAATWLYGRFHLRFPNGLTNEAQAVVEPADHPSLSTLTPLLVAGAYDKNAGYLQSQRLAGKDLWLYTSGGMDQDVNRLISQPLSETRLLPWMVTSVGGDGFLHWGYNYWVDTPDGLHFTATDTFNGGSSGDPFLVRPNKATYGIYDSLRSEALLAGTQDGELFRQLAATKPVAARTLLNTVITNTSTYDKSGADLDQRHKQLLDALVAPGGDLRLPFKDDFSSGVDANWRHTAGSWSVTADHAYVQSSTDTSTWDVVSAVAGRAYGDLAAGADVQITGVNATDGGNNNWAGVTVHSLNPTDIDSGYLIAIRNTGQVFVYRSGSTLATGQIPGYTAGRLVHLRVVAKGGTLQVYTGSGDPLLTVTDSGFPVGSFGLATGGASARFANVRINPMVNPVEGASVSVSTAYQADGWSPQAAADGSRNSTADSMGWSSARNTTAASTEWIQEDLGAVTPLSRIDLYPRNDGANTGLGFPVDFSVQISPDGTNWTTVAAPTGYPRPGAGAQSFPFATTGVRYIKVTGTKLSADQFGGYYMQLAEIEGVGGDLALGRPVSSSSSVEDYWAGWVRSVATDGVLASNLSYSMGFSSLGGTTQHPEWVSVDLEGTGPISRVDLTGRTDGANTGLGFPADFTVQVSVDGTNWTTVASRTGYPRPDATAQSFSFAPVTARYVRVAASSLSADQYGTYYLQLGEIAVG
ncbi:discoidin domain-containing protein [Kitasatospora sp. NPDC001660]